jgi:hypothetical protein
VSERRKYLAGVMALVGMVAAAFPLLTLAFCDAISGCTDTGARSLFGGSYVFDDFALVSRGCPGQRHHHAAALVGYLER